jgi:hypothetical protein
MIIARRGAKKREHDRRGRVADDRVWRSDLKRLLSVLLLGVIGPVTVACSGSDGVGGDPNGEHAQLPRIAIAGLAIESSTFSPARTHKEAFHSRRGDEVFDYYSFLSAETPLRGRAEWISTLRGHALPGEIVTREAYESLVQETPAEADISTVSMAGKDPDNHPLSVRNSLGIINSLSPHSSSAT